MRFSTVLGPGSDGYHENHAHVDLAERRGNYKICQWDLQEKPRPVPVAKDGEAEAGEGGAEAGASVPLPRPRPSLASDRRSQSRRERL